jgi:hypothetical protein
MRWTLALAVLVACACPSKQTGTPTTTGSGTPTGSSGGAPPTATGCEGVRAKVQQLYRAEAQVKEPKRVEEAVADNTAMVMGDCAKAPDQVSACIARVTTINDLEATCLPQLDDEGREGDAVAP